MHDVDGLLYNSGIDWCLLERNSGIGVSVSDMSREFDFSTKIGLLKIVVTDQGLLFK